jgi:ATP-dependent Lon protease
MGLKIEMKHSRNEALQSQLKSIHSTLQETKRQMVDLATLECRLQASCLPLETMSKEMLAFQ